MGPDAVVAEVRLAVRVALESVDGPVLVACSGGPDSVALAAAVAFEAPRSGVPAGLVTVDHGMQDGSDAQAARVVEFGRSLGLHPVESVRVEVGRDGGPEAAARAARYAALRALADRDGARVVLGHTRDDQAETVLLGLGRGSGPRSIGGMRAADGILLRPLLGIDRATTLAACVAQGLPVWHDPMNADDRFVRVRLRREVLPLLEDVLSGGVAASLARTAELLRDDLAALDEWAVDAYARASPRDHLRDRVDSRPGSADDHPGGGAAIEVDALLDLPRAVRTRVLRRWAADLGAGPLTAGHTAALDALVTAWRGQGPIQLPGGVAVRRRSATLEIIPPPQETPRQE